MTSSRTFESTRTPARCASVTARERHDLVGGQLRRGGARHAPDDLVVGLATLRPLEILEDETPRDLAHVAVLARRLQLESLLQVQLELHHQRLDVALFPGCHASPPRYQYVFPEYVLNVASPTAPR